ELEPHRLAPGQGHVAGGEPAWMGVRASFAEPATDHLRPARRAAQERGIGVPDPVVDEAAGLVPDDLADHEALGHRLEQRTVALARVAPPALAITFAELAHN